MNNDRELMQDALDALNNFDKGNHGMRWQVLLIKALRARLSQPEPAQCDGGQCGIGGYCKQCPKTRPEREPVAWGVPNTRPAEKAQFMMLLHSADGCQYPDQLVPLYTASPQREWVGLTDEEYEAMAEQYVTNCYFDTLKYAKAIEAKLKEKNT